MPGVDLHAHTTASDGSLPPAFLVGYAASLGLDAVAITDHDTLDGLDEALEAGPENEIEVVPGVEFAVDYGHGKMDLLGLLIDPRDTGLPARIDLLRSNRSSRNDRMLARMRELGIDITLDDLRAASTGGQMGRPHMARVLVGKGVVSSVAEAFEKYLGAGCAAYVPKDKISVAEGIGLIHGAGGVAVLAHPMTLKLADDQLGPELDSLRALGLDAVECYYSQHTPEYSLRMLALADAAGLLVSGGSDYHGATKPHVFLGHVAGDQPMAREVLGVLKDRKRELAEGRRTDA